MTIDARITTGSKVWIRVLRGGECDREPAIVRGITADGYAVSVARHGSKTSFTREIVVKKDRVIGLRPSNPAMLRASNIRSLVK